MEIVDTTNKNLNCPLMSGRLSTIDGSGISATRCIKWVKCQGPECAWWIEVNDFRFGSSTRKVGRCSIAQLAKEINCNIGEG